MKTRLFILLAAVFVFTCQIDAQIKLHQGGGISIGSDSDPGDDIISLDNEVVFSTITSNVNPETSGTFSLGGSNSKWDKLYVNELFTDDISDEPNFPDGLRTNTIDTYSGSLSVEGTYGDISFGSGQNNYLSITTDQDYFKFNEGIDIDDQLYIYSSSSGTFKLESTYTYLKISTSPTPYLDFTTGTSYFRFQKPVYHVGPVFLYSDLSIKENIIKIKDKGSSIEKIKMIDGIEYNFKEDVDNKRVVGFSAQEVQNVLPNLVFEDEEGLLSINYYGMIPYLLEAIKEQDERIIQLENALQESLLKTME